MIKPILAFFVRALLSICMALLVFSSLAYANNAHTPIRIGVILNPYDRFFLIQRPIYNGIRLFFESKTDYAIDLISTSDDLEGQIKAAKETTNRSLHFVIGHNFSGLAEAYLRALPKDAAITYVTPYATSTGLAAIRKNIYLIWPDNERQIHALVAFALKNKIRTKKVVAVVNESETYSTDMGNLFTELLAKNRIAVDKISYIRNSFNAKALAEWVKHLNPTLLFLPIYNRELVELYQALWETTSNKEDLPIVICGDTVGTESDFYKLLGGKVKIPNNRFFFTNGFAKELLKNSLDHFAAMYRNRFGEAPDAGAVAGYHAAEILYALIQNGNDISRPLNIAGWRAKFDSSNRLIRPLVLNEISSSGFIMREIIND